MYGYYDDDDDDDNDEDNDNEDNHKESRICFNRRVGPESWQSGKGALIASNNSKQ